MDLLSDFLQNPYFRHVNNHASKLSHDMIKFVFSKKATKIDEIFVVDLTLTKYVHNVKSTVKISLIFVAFLENLNFKSENVEN